MICYPESHPPKLPWGPVVQRLFKPAQAQVVYSAIFLYNIYIVIDGYGSFSFVSSKVIFTRKMWENLTIESLEMHQSTYSRSYLPHYFPSSSTQFDNLS